MFAALPASIAFALNFAHPLLMWVLLGLAGYAMVLGIKAKNEAKRATKYVNRLGVDGVESVLLYHVIAGQKINAKTAAGADGAKLETALGQKFTVNVTHEGIFLKDRARDIANPKVIVTDINKGNKQIAHAINRVLLPAL